MVRFEKVTKRFGTIVALEDISLEVKEGEFVFITGPSGSGKTTLIRLLLRELTPDEGKISIEDRDIATLKSRDLPFYRRKIGVVFQDFKLIPDRTVYENVNLALEIADEAKDGDKKIKEALEEVGLLERASLFPRQLAGGELQRAVLARALVGRPKLILADEPTGNLDPGTARGIVKLLDHAAHDGTTVLMSTHNADIVNNLKRRVIRFKKGKIVGDNKSGGYEE